MGLFAVQKSGVHSRFVARCWAAARVYHRGYRSVLPCCEISAAHPAEHHALPPRKSQVECRKSFTHGRPEWHQPSRQVWVGWVRRGGVAAKTCAAIGRSERRVIIAPGLARIASRTDTSPVRLARASPGIDSDAALRFPASRNPMTAQVLPQVEARHGNRDEKASSIGADRLSSGVFFAGTHRGPSRARLL